MPSTGTCHARGRVSKIRSAWSHRNVAFRTEPSFSDDRLINQAENSSNCGTHERGTGKITNCGAEHDIHAAEESPFGVDPDKKLPTEATQKTREPRQPYNHLPHCVRTLDDAQENETRGMPEEKERRKHDTHHMTCAYNVPQYPIFSFNIATQKPKLRAMTVTAVNIPMTKIRKLELKESMSPFKRAPANTGSMTMLIISMSTDKNTPVFNANMSQKSDGNCNCHPRAARQAAGNARTTARHS